MARDAKNILTNHYKQQISDTQDRYSNGPKSAGSQAARSFESAADKAKNRMIDTAKKGTKNVAGNAIDGVKDAVKSHRFYKAKNEEAIARMKKSAAQKGRRPASGGSPNAAQSAKKKLQIKRGNDLKFKRQSVKEATAKGNASRELSSSKAAQGGIKNNAGNAPKTRQGPGNLPGKQAANTTQKQTATAQKTVSHRIKKTGDIKLHSQKKQRMLKLRGKGSSLKTSNPVTRFTARHAQKKIKQKAEKKAQKAAVQKAKQLTVKAAKLSFNLLKKLIVAAVKLIKAISMVLAGVASLLPVLIIIGVVAAVLASPFGLLFSDQDTSAEVEPIGEVVAQTNIEFDAKIGGIINSHSYVDSVQMHYPGSVDGVKINNWIDVLVVFATKTSMSQNDADAMDVITIDTTRIDLIKQVFWDMNEITYYVQTIHHTSDDDDWYEYILHITVTSKTAEQQATDYGFTDDQKEVMRELLKPEYTSYLFNIMGISSADLTDEELQEILGNLPAGELASSVIEAAMTRLGDPYSIKKAGTGRYTDCSHLMQWSYKQVGISLPRNAAQQGKYIVDNGLEISKSELQPGDLVFWSYGANDRYMNIGHVGIYVGDGKVLHASSVDMQVVIEPLFHADKQVLYGRIG